jgi:hypothetical protein
MPTIQKLKSFNTSIEFIEMQRWKVWVDCSFSSKQYSTHNALLVSRKPIGRVFVQLITNLKPHELINPPLDPS